MSWERVVCPKAEGAIEFHNFKTFKLATVAKQG